MKVRVIGAGLAGCEAAYYLANKGVEVELIDENLHILLLHIKVNI